MISPDAIKDLVDRDFKSVNAERRHNPDGWSFFLRNTPGNQTTRIAGAVRAWPGGPTFFRLVVSSRLSGTERELEAESAEQVRDLLLEEIRLCSEHFGHQPM